MFSDDGYSDTFWQYKGLIEFIATQVQGLYGLNSQRIELHKKLEKEFIGKEVELKAVLHNLPADYTPYDLRWAVNNFDEFRKHCKKEYNWFISPFK